MCIFCEGKHLGDACEVINTIEARRQFFQEKKLFFSCGHAGHWGKQCRSRGCFKCKSKHHTTLCDKDKNRPPGDNVTVLISYSPSTDEWSLPTIIPVKIKGEIFWTYLDTGAGGNIITSEAAKRLNLKAERHEVREILTVNGTKRQSMPIFNLLIESLDGKESEKVQVTGTKLRDFTTVRRPDINKLKEQCDWRRVSYTRDLRRQYLLSNKNRRSIHLQSEEPIVEGTTFGWVIHGENDSDSQSFFSRETSDYERLLQPGRFGGRGQR